MQIVGVHAFKLRRIAGEGEREERRKKRTMMTMTGEKGPVFSPFLF